MDRAVAHIVWEGRIPIVFCVHPSEGGLLGGPEPFYVLAPRIAYLPLVLPREHFSKNSIAAALSAAATPAVRAAGNVNAISSSNNSNGNSTAAQVSSVSTTSAPTSLSNHSETSQQPQQQQQTSGNVDDDENNPDVWFSSGELPLKWHYPLGVLFDLLNLSHKDLPWRIYVHFKNFPDEKLFRCPFYFTGVDQRSQTQLAGATIERPITGPLEIFMSTIKQADYIRNGNSNKIMNLPRDDQRQLWEGLAQQNFDVFWKVQSKLVNLDVTSPSGYPRNIPFRLYVADEPFCQEPFAPLDKSGKENTLADLLAQFIIGTNINKTLPGSSEPSEDAASDNVLPTVRAVIHGISPPLETPVWWLMQNFSYPDNFLHIVVCIDTKERSSTNASSAK